MNYVDIAILALITAMAVFGVYKGFIKSMISLLSFIISLSLAILLARVVADALLNVDTIGGWVAGDKSLYSKIFEKLPKSLENVSTQSLRSMPAEEVIENDAPWYLSLFYPMIKGCLDNEIYLDALKNARQIIALEMAYGVYVLIVGIVLFICIRIIAAGAGIALKKYTKGKKTLSGRAVGALIGGGKAIVYCMIFLSIITLVSGFEVMRPFTNEIADSKLGSPLARASMTITSSVLDSKNDDRYHRLVEICNQDTSQKGEIAASFILWLDSDDMPDTPRLVLG